MKNYNIFALRGDTEVSDVEVCQALGLPMELAGTPDLNTVALKAMHKQNYDGFVAAGMNPNDAMERADKARAQAEREIRELSKQ